MPSAFTLLQTAHEIERDRGRRRQDNAHGRYRKLYSIVSRSATGTSERHRNCGLHEALILDLKGVNSQCSRMASPRPALADIICVFLVREDCIILVGSFSCYEANDSIAHNPGRSRKLGYLFFLLRSSDRT